MDQFPSFFESIQERIRQTTTHHFNDDTAEDLTGLRFLPFNIFGFIDCSIYQCRRPFAGPAGDYIGAPHKSQYYRTQQVVCTRYKKLHGVKVETVMLPNGISTIFGPVSARPYASENQILSLIRSYVATGLPWDLLVLSDWSFGQ